LGLAITPRIDHSPTWPGHVARPDVLVEGFAGRKRRAWSPSHPRAHRWKRYSPHWTRFALPGNTKTPSQSCLPQSVSRVAFPDRQTYPLMVQYCYMLTARIRTRHDRAGSEWHLHRRQTTRSTSISRHFLCQKSRPSPQVTTHLLMACHKGLVPLLILRIHLTAWMYSSTTGGLSVLEAACSELLQEADEACDGS
jgi:hypothetical protein